MNLLIAGAGIGGMALAGLLRQRGIGCELVERSEDFLQAGYVVTLYPMGARVLHGLGVFEAFEKVSSPFRAYEVYNGGGELLHRFDASSISEAFGYTGQIRRGDLISLLRDAAPDVPLRMGVSVERIEQSGRRVEAGLSDGTSGLYDAVIGADGIHSNVRRVVFGEEPDRETGWRLCVWWSAVDIPLDTVREYWGKGRFVGVYPTPSGTAAVAAAPCHLLGPAVSGGRGGNVRELFDGMAGGALEAIQGFPDETAGLFTARLADFRSARWVHRRVALVGDAACAFLPVAGVGASMALESAAVMADELSRADAAAIPGAFDFYQLRRRQRVESAQDEARKLLVWMAAESSPLVWTREQFVRHASSDTLVRMIARSLETPI
jgi:2-polyprenyl-6-methoxyphenol hydroxylase-like FAD-dependent oxidoreductase